MITLALTTAEAVSLDMFTRLIGGCPDASLRQYSDSISRKLRNQGLPLVENLHDYLKGGSSITCKPRSTEKLRKYLYEGAKDEPVIKFDL